MSPYQAFGMRIAADQPLPLYSSHEGGSIQLQLVASSQPLAPLAKDPSELEAAGWMQVHDGVDSTGRLRVARQLDAPGVAIDCGAFAFRFEVGGETIAYDTLPQGRGTPFGVAVTRVVLPLFRWLAKPPVVAFHASAVAIDGGAMLMVGESGSGKSTTAYQWSRCGGRLLADDLVLCERETLQILPGTPEVRLWREASSLDDAIDAGPVVEGSAKRSFYLKASSMLQRSLPLRAVAVMCPDATARRAEILPLRGADRLATLLRMSFDVQRPPQSWSVQRLQVMSHIERHRPVAKVRYPLAWSQQTDLLTALHSLHRSST